ncbi:unnamed protein product [Closterium sp. NIES-53]
MFWKESRSKFILLVAYVDDLLYTGDATELLDQFEADIKEKLEATINHNVTQFLGLNITQSATSIHLSATKYAETLAKKFVVAPINLTTPYRTPPPNHEPDTTPLSIDNHRRYQQQLGCLLFVAVTCRPDLSYVASQLAQYLKRPEGENLLDLRRALQCFVSTPDVSLTYKANLTATLQLHGYSFTLPDSPQQNGIAERRIGLVMEVAPQPLAPCLLTGDLAHTALDGGGWRCVGVLGRAFIRDTSADKPSACAIPFVFLGFVPGTPGWLFYHPTLRHVLPSQDVTFDESVPFYRLFFYRSALPPPPSLFLAPGPPPLGPLPPQGPARSGVSQVDPLPGTGPVEIAVISGDAPGGASGVVASGGAEPGGAGSEGDGSRGAEPEGVEPGDAESEGAESGGAEPRGAALSGGPAGASPRLSPQQLREWLVRRACLRSGAPGAGGAGDAGAGGAGVTAGAGGAGGTTTASPGGARTRAAGARGTGAGGAGVGGTGAGGAGAAGARAGGAGGTVRPRLPAVLQSVVSLRLVLSRLFALLVALLVRALLLSPARMLCPSILPPFHCVFLCLILLSPLFLSIAFLQGSLHEEIWLRRPPGFTGRLASGTTLAALGFAPATADPSLFLRTDTLLPPFYVLVYINDLVFATANTEALTLVKSFSASASSSPRHSPLLCLPATRSELHLRTSPTSGMGLVLGGRGLVVLTGHADVSWVDDSATQRSSQGYTCSLGSDSVSWRSTRSSSVLSSRCEVEIYAGAMAAQELCWLTYLLTDLGEQPRLPPQRGQLCLAYVATRANTADIFTKALPPSDHQRFSTVLGLVPTVPHLLTA